MTKSIASDATTVYISSNAAGIPLYGNLAISNSASTALTFSGLSFSNTGTVNIVAYAIGYTSVTSSSVGITNAVSVLYFASQVSSSSNPCSGGVTLKALHPPIGLLSTDTSFGSTITLNLISGNGGGTMVASSCTAASGSCSISTCTVTGYGNFILSATSPGLTTGYSNSFTLTSGSPSTVVINPVTGTVYRGQTFTVTATVKDSSGIKVNQAIQFYLVSTGTGTVVQGGIAIVSSGTLTFSSVIINNSGSNTLSVTCPACSTAPTVTTITVSVGTYGLLVVGFPKGIVESGSSQYYTLSLSSAPSSQVTISIASSDNSILSITTPSLTFTTSNYNTAQNVYLNVYTILSSTFPYDVTITHSLTSSDWTYSGTADLQSCMSSPSPITVPIYGYQDVSINVDSSGSVSEDSETNIKVYIGSQPTNDVSILITTVSSYFTLSTAKLTFTSSNWSTKQSFNVIGPSAGSLGGVYKTGTISYTVSTSDPSYSSSSVIKTPSPLSTNIVITPIASYTIQFDSAAAIIMSKNYQTYNVRLSSQPKSSVTVTLTSTSNAVVSPTSLTFTNSDGTIYQEVQVYAANTSPAGTPAYNVLITHTAASSDAHFSGITAEFSLNLVNVCWSLPYNWPNSDKCTCPAGFNCEGTTPVPCPAGTYSLSNQYTCTACPAGSSCADPTASPVPCSTGYYSYNYYTSCYPCPPGFICPSQNGYLMQRCLQGTYPSGNTCTSPSAGSMVTSPEYALVIACAAGYYSQGSSDLCVPCPAGYSCTGNTATVCSAGTYSLPGMGVCNTCPSHYECDPALGPTRICQEGTYRVSGTTSCVLCTANYYCTASESTRPVACPSGYKSVAGSSYCTYTSGSYASYPGLTMSGSTITPYAAASSGDYSNYVLSFSSYTSNIKCLEYWGRCYPTPPGENDLGVAAAIGGYSYPGSNTVSTTAFPGYVTPAYAERPDPIGFEVEPGYYTTTGTSETVCPSGTFNPNPRGSSASSCITCPPGYFCGTGVGDYEQSPCPVGYYCNAGITALTSFKCPAGTYRNKLRGIEQGSCDQCPEGYSCPTASSDPTVCPRGSICPIGSAAAISCPEGTYNLFTGKYRLEDCILCPAGSSCGIGATYNAWCPPGTFNPFLGSSTCFPCTPGYACIGYNTIKPYIKCQIGYYCPESSTVPIQQACPPGTIGNMYGAYSVTQCDKCPPGFYCGYNTNYVNNPPIECEAGYYCPIGTTIKYKYPCPPGTYNPSTRLEGIHECLACPAGSYCLTGSISTTACPIGYYCPVGTQYLNQYPCQAGTYRDSTGATLQGDCIACPKGNYCPQASTGATPCPTGTYMDELGATGAGPGSYPSCKTCPAGYYSSSTGSTVCTPAAPGFYTASGATAQIACLIGYFCANAGTSEYAMRMQPCPPGYLCPAGSSNYPTLASNGCPAGSYCLEGATTSTPCPIGTFRNTAGGKSIYDCITSPAGYYVSAVGTSDYSPYTCQAGYYCPAGSTSGQAQSCPLGTYRTLTGGKSASDCASCPPGFYCNTLATTSPVNCPASKYCPAGTITPIQCPSGTYSASTNLKTSSDCTPCDAGKYCEAQGQTAPKGDCLAGYYCMSGSTLAAPTDKVTGALCPAGGYCLAGGSTPSKCSAGTFNNFAGGLSSADCVSCWPGSYCLGDNNPLPTGLCTAGYYCIGSATTSQQNQAQAGYYAPSGSVAQIPCLQGYYNPSVGQPTCSQCPAGSSCGATAMTSYTSCTAGYYCVQGSAVPAPCPSGTFRSTQGAQSLDQCTPCSSGSYCLSYALTGVTGTCDDGYYCTSGAPTNQPWIESAGNFGRCPSGSYCLSGVITACPQGTYNPTPGANILSGCAKCPGGYACPNTGTVSYSLQCRRGYYCTQGSTTNQPSSGICSAGSYCPTGSAVQLLVPAGTYQDTTAQYSSITCLPGYYCPIGTVSYSSNPCQAGYYCPSGTAYTSQYPCLAGTYNPYTGKQDSGSCQSCSPGSYCSNNGASAVTGTCQGGFYCASGSTSSRPSTGKCLKGTYCPVGSSYAILCDPGHYCPDDQMSAVGPQCYAGYYCTSGASTPTPTDGSIGNICPTQYYCPAGSYVATQCPTGTYIPYTGASSSSECLSCTPGYYCDGDSAQPLKLCTAGYYCPGGDSNPTHSCSRGYYCPAGSPQPILCAAGTYQSNSLSSSCTACSAGYYCPAGSYTQTLCPKGYYCPANTQYNYQYPCPVGTYNSYVGKSLPTSCVACDSGKFCGTQGASASSGLCNAGYYCTSSAVIPNPTDGTTGNICPSGYYCPQGSGSPTPCDAGSYCNQQGLSQVSGSCAQGYYCITKATTPTPTDGTTGNICSLGYYCPAGSSSKQPCPIGTYGPSYGMAALSDCLQCNYGMYCSAQAIASPSGTCSQGYYCVPGKTSATPIDGTCPVGYFCDNINYYVQFPCLMGTYNILTGQSACTGCPAGYYCAGGTALNVLCPKGYYCPSNTRFSNEFPCPSGTYSSVLGSSVCTTCPAGYVCYNAAQTSNNLCPIYKYCVAGTGYGLLCPGGTYNKDYQGLGSSSLCTQCPAGQYCVDGTQSGQCAPGFLCLGGSTTPTPVVTVGNNGLCPAGSYCLIGSVTATICPDGKFRKDPGARASTDCTSCPPGSYCLSGVSTPYACPTGSYCPLGIQTPIKCPIYTYNDQLNADNPNFCKICPAGYFCSTTGISDYKQYPCKIGYFCVQGATQYIKCPPGTYTNAINTGSKDQCKKCIGGYYCPSYSTLSIICPIGTYCPGGNASPYPCIPGYYCNTGTITPTPCPFGYYCPAYNSSFNSSSNSPPFPCLQSNLCPGAYFDQATCNPGYYFDGVKCDPCPAGTYSRGQTSTACLSCDAGYLCTGGAIRADPQKASDGGYPCLAGYYCPAGAQSAIACPVSTYNPNTQQSSLSSCLSCPNNTYGISSGQSKCLVCGSSAYSSTGSTYCNCTGKYRGWSPYDGTCKCIPTYTYYLNGVENKDDSDQNCIPIIYQHCTASGTTRFSDGSCVDDTNVAKYCNGGSGRIYKGHAVCDSDSSKNQESYCSSDTCIPNQPTTSMDSSGNFYVYNPNTGQTVSISKTASNYLNHTSCSGSCKVHNLDFTNDGAKGNYGCPTALTQSYYSNSNRMLQSIQSSSIPNVLACIKAGDTFIFSLTPKNHFPVYLKNSLLNTNSNFDYGAFTELGWRMQSSESNVDTFAFTFTDAGVYNFVDNADQTQSVVIVVKASDQSCPSSATVFYSRNTQNIDSLGLYPLDNMIENAQWGIIVGILIAAFIVLLICIAFISFLHWRAWATSHARERLLRLVKDCFQKCRMSSKRGLVLPLMQDDENSDSIDIDKDLLEPSQFTDMLQKLNRYYNQLKAAFDSQDEEAKRGLEDLLGQARDLKIMLGDRLSDIDPVVLRSKIKEANLEISDDDDKQEILEILPIPSSVAINNAMNAYVEVEEGTKAKIAEQVNREIMNNPNLLDQDKEELLADFNANMQRIDQFLNNDIQKAQDDINKRLQERAARRKAAEREKAYIEPKRLEIIERGKNDKINLNKEIEDDIIKLEQEFIEERDKIKKENRKEIDGKLKEMRTQLQINLMSAKSQIEIDNLMKIFEIEAKRAEDQLLNDKKQQEGEMLKKLEERRKKRLDKILSQSEAKKAEVDARVQEDLESLEERALLAVSKVPVEIQLDINEEQLILEVGLNYNKQKYELEAKHQLEIDQIDQEIQIEDNQKILERERLEKLIQAATSEEEKNSLVKALEDADNAIFSSKAKQEDKLKAQLMDRKRRRAEKEAEIKARHEIEIKEIELQKYNAEKEVKSVLELKKMEELLNSNENYTPEELIGMARELLEAKHDRETAELTALKHKNLRERQNEALKSALGNKASEKASARVFYEEAKGKIMQEKIDPKDKKAKIDELESKMQESDSQIDYNFIVNVNSTQDKIWREIEDEFKQHFNELASVQTKEIQEIMTKIKFSDHRMLDANISDMEREINQQRSELERKYAEKLRELDRRALEIKENERQKLLEIDYINAQMKEVDEKQRKLDEIAEQRRIMEERQQKVLETMKERGISAEKMEEIIKQHQQEMDEWEKAMENERIRQQQKLQAKLDQKKQKYQEKISSQIQKYKEENLKLIEQQEEAEQNKLKIVFDSGKDLKLWTPKVEIDTRLRFPDFEQEVEIAKIASTSLLDEVVDKVRRVEKIAENIDTTQFSTLLKAFSDVSDMMDIIKSNYRA